MTTEPDESSETTPAPDAEPGFWDKLTKVIDEHVGATLGKLFDTGKADVKDGAEAGGDPAPGRDRSDVAAEVKREVAKLREAEAKEAEKQSVAERIAALEEKLKKAAENPPEELRPITEWMWR